MLFNLYFVFDLEIITPKNQCARLLSGSGKSLTHCLLYNLGQQKLGCPKENQTTLFPIKWFTLASIRRLHVLIY